MPRRQEIGKRSRLRRQRAALPPARATAIEGIGAQPDARFRCAGARALLRRAWRVYRAEHFVRCPCRQQTARRFRRRTRAFSTGLSGGPASSLAILGADCAMVGIKVHPKAANATPRSKLRRFIAVIAVHSCRRVRPRLLGSLCAPAHDHQAKQSCQAALAVPAPTRRATLPQWQQDGAGCGKEMRGRGIFIWLRSVAWSRDRIAPLCPG